MSPQLYEHLGRFGEKFFRLVPTQSLCTSESATLACCVLGTTFEPQTTVTLCRRRIKLVSIVKQCLTLSVLSVFFAT